MRMILGALPARVWHQVSGTPRAPRMRQRVPAHACRRAAAAERARGVYGECAHDRVKCLPGALPSTVALPAARSRSLGGQARVFNALRPPSGAPRLRLARHGGRGGAGSPGGAHRRPAPLLRAHLHRVLQARQEVEQAQRAGAPHRGSALAARAAAVFQPHADEPAAARVARAVLEQRHHSRPECRPAGGGGGACAARRRSRRAQGVRASSRECLPRPGACSAQRLAHQRSSLPAPPRAPPLRLRAPGSAGSAGCSRSCGSAPGGGSGLHQHQRHGGVSRRACAG